MGKSEANQFNRIAAPPESARQYLLALAATALAATLAQPPERLPGLLD